MLPLMLVAVPAGAIADMFDRRKVAMTGLGFASAAGIGLTAIAVLGLTTPWTLLLFCSLIGAGVALYSPAWQSSIIEQVHKIGRASCRERGCQYVLIRWGGVVFK